jgi:hypothetical protein
MGPARIYPCRKMHRSRAPSIAPGTFFVAQPWADSITNMPGFNLRQAQPKGLHRIRHYGLLAKGACADNIARARELLAVAKSEALSSSTAADPGKPLCPCCGGHMIIIEVFERGTTPRHRPTAPTTVIRIDTS